MRISNGECEGEWKEGGILECNYESLVNELSKKWGEISWLNGDEEDKREYSFVVSEGGKSWNVYNWNEDGYKKKWFIAGNGSIEERERVKRRL